MRDWHDVGRQSVMLRDGGRQVGLSSSVSSPSSSSRAPGQHSRSLNLPVPSSHSSRLCSFLHIPIDIGIPWPNSWYIRSSHTRSSAGCSNFKIDLIRQDRSPDVGHSASSAGHAHSDQGSNLVKYSCRYNSFKWHKTNEGWGSKQQGQMPLKIYLERVQWYHLQSNFAPHFNFDTTMSYQWNLYYGASIFVPRSYEQRHLSNCYFYRSLIVCCQFTLFVD